MAPEQLQAPRDERLINYERIKRKEKKKRERKKENGHCSMDDAVLALSSTRVECCTACE